MSENGKSLNGRTALRELFRQRAGNLLGPKLSEALVVVSAFHPPHRAITELLRRKLTTAEDATLDYTLLELFNPRRENGRIGTSVRDSD